MENEKLTNNIDETTGVVQEKEKKVLYDNDLIKVVLYSGLDKNKKPYKLTVVFIHTEDLDIPLYPKDNASAKLIRLHFQDLAESNE